MVQPIPLLSRSASATRYPGPGLTNLGQSYAPSSYRNAMMGSPISVSVSSGYGQVHSPKPGVNSSFSQPMFLPSETTVRPSFSFGMMNHHDVVLSNAPQWDPNMDLYDKRGQTRDRGQGMLADEFPHLDIINDLLDDEYSIPVGPGPGSSFNGPRHLSHQYSFPGDMGGGSTLDPGPSTSSCRFERTRSYHEEFQHGYGGGGGPFDFSRDMMPAQPDLQYVDESVDRSGQSQWRVGGSDSFYWLRNMDRDGGGYQYQMAPPDYSMGVNRYTVYRPNGH